MKPRSDFRSERGAVLMFVALTILVLAGFSAFVIDQGVLWVSRNQAQNAADAGALAGAVARGFDDNVDLTSTGKAYLNAKQTAEANKIWTATGSVQVDWTCPADRVDLAANSCVRVDVERGAPDRGGTVQGTSLPTFFGKLINVSSYGVRATATAVPLNANHTQCLKPFFIPDKWWPLGDPNVWPDPDNSFDPGAGDVYQTPSTSGPGTGYTLADIGKVVTLTPSGPHAAYEPSDYFLVGDDVDGDIRNCTLHASIGDTLNAKPGGTVGQVNHGIDDLVANGPVTVVIAMWAPTQYEAMGRPHGGNWDMTVVNMLGFRIDGMDGNKGVHGTIIGAPGDVDGNNATIGGNASLVKVIEIIR